MVLYRAVQDLIWVGLLEGFCISEGKFKSIYYTDKPLLEVIQEYEVKDMIEYKDEVFCIEHGIEKVLFYLQNELDLFLKKVEK